MHKAEIIFFGATIFLYLLWLSIMLFLRITSKLQLRLSEARIFLNYTLYSGFLCHLFTIVLRWDFSGHPPIMGTYESALAGSWITVLLTIIFPRKFSEFDIVQASALFLSIILMLYGLLFPTAYIPLTISEQSLWVDFHALSAWLAYGSYVISFCSAIVLLFQKNIQNTASSGKSGLNALIMNDVMFYTLCLGFFFQTLMMVTGSYYNFILFGRWWRWDPIESIALISWVVSALVIHVRLFYNWSGKGLATLVIVAFSLVIILHKIFPFIPRHLTFHNFDIKF